MAKKLIKKLEDDGIVIKVYYDSEWEEYSCVPPSRAEEDIYYTSDKQDALDTAKKMLETEIDKKGTKTFSEIKSQEFFDKDDFLDAAEEKGYDVEYPKKVENTFAWYAYFAYKGGDPIGYFDVDANTGEMFDSFEDFDAAMNEMPSASITSSKDYTEFTDYKAFVDAAKEMGLETSVTGQGGPESGPTGDMGEIWASDVNGDVYGYFDQEGEGSGILFTSPTKFIEYVNTDNPEDDNVEAKEAAFADDAIQGLIKYLKQNKAKLHGILDNMGQNKLEEELKKTPAGGSSKGSLVTSQVEQWLNGINNDSKLVQNLEKIFKKSSSKEALDAYDDPSLAFDQGEKDLNKYGKKVAAPQIVTNAAEIEDMLKTMILGQVRNIMKKLGNGEESAAIKDIYFQLDEALHKALKLAQQGSKKINEAGTLKESKVLDVEIKAKSKKSSLHKVLAYMETGGVEKVVDSMSPVEIDGIIEELPSDYNAYPELSAVKDILVDALVALSEFEASHVATDEETKSKGIPEEGTADSNTEAFVDNTDLHVESPFAEHDSVYASLDSAKLMHEADLLTKEAYNTHTDVKTLDDDALMEYKNHLEKDPSPDNSDAHQKALDRTNKELSDRGFHSASQVEDVDDAEDTKGSDIQAAVEFMANLEEMPENMTVADMLKKLTDAKFTIGVAHLAMTEVFGSDCLSMLNTPLSTII